MLKQKMIKMRRSMHWWKKLGLTIEEDWQKKVEKYVNGVIFTKKDEAKAEEKMKLEEPNQLNECYGLLIRYTLQLEDGPIYDKTRLRMMWRIYTRGIWQEAIWIELNKSRHFFKKLWNNEDDDEDNYNDEDDDDDDDDNETPGNEDWNIKRV